MFKDYNKKSNLLYFNQAIIHFDYIKKNFNRIIQIFKMIVIAIIHIHSFKIIKYFDFFINSNIIINLNIIIDFNIIVDFVKD